MSDLQLTYLGNRVDFIKSDFDLLVDQKGRNVLFEKALRCPCKSEATNQLSNCRNCGGTGWVFVDPINTRMVLFSVSNVNDFKDWSENSRGFVNITAKDEDEVGWMDRITLLDGKGYMSEVLHFHTVENKTFAFVSYPIKAMQYVGLYDGVTKAFIKLKNGVDYIIDGQVVFLIRPNLSESPSATVRYVYSPSFYILELKRETMQSFVIEQGAEKIKNFPISCVGRRAHYVLGAPSAFGDKLIVNQYENEAKCNNNCQY